MSTVNGFQVGSETLKYNYESLENYNTPNFSSSSSKAYAIGDYVMYNGKLYKCTTATTGGTWDANDWEEAILSDDVTDQKNAINQKAPLIINTASGDIASFADGADGMPIKKLVGTIEPVQSGTGDPSPDNVRPISGWTGCNIHGTGKNLLGGIDLANRLALVYGNTYMNYDDKTLRFPYTGTASDIDALGVKFKENTQYTFILALSNPQLEHSNMTIVYTDGSVTYVPDSVATTESIKVVVSTAGKTVRGLGKKQSGGTTYVYYDDSGIFEGVLTAADFVSYVGQTLSINWQTEAGTIYGGTVTLNEDGSADLIVSWAKIKIADIRQADFITSGYGEHIFATGLYYLPKKAHGNGNVFSPIYKTSPNVAVENLGDYAIRGLPSANTIYIRDVRYTTVAEFFAAQKDTEIVYELGQPTDTYHVDNVGKLYTCLGTNNVWIDIGAITECDYPADTKLYVDGLTEPDEDMIADGLIASGKYFTVNNQLYLSTTQIAAGAQITPGSNCTATSITEALNALNT